ncbi:MAG: thioredoxin [Chloroflexia bacterium]|nr:thioredoxin [Chloroflexia bacterium]
MPATADHENIKILNNKNFKTQIKSGVVMVDFWAPWCGPCKMVAPTLNSIAETESDKVIVAKVNVDKEQQIAQKFKIRNIPTMIIFKDGKEAKRIVGVKSKKMLMKEVELLLN